MKWLRRIDMFGSGAHFSFFGKERYQTGFGGGLSLAFWLLCSFFGFLLCRDALFKRNPKVVMSNEHGFRDMRRMMMGDSLVLPWTIEDSMGNEVELKGFIYPVVYLMRYSRDSLTKELYVANRLRLGYEHCKANAFKHRFEFDISHYYCINMSEVTIGGSIEVDYLDFIAIYLSYCPNGNPYNQNANCTDPARINSSVDKGLVFKMKYPELIAQPHHLDKPIKISYASFEVMLDVNLQKDDAFFFNEVKLIDDTSLMFTDHRSSSFIALAKHTQDANYFPNDKLHQKDAMSFFYFCSVYLTKDALVYSRSYAKIQDSLGSIGGCIYLLAICFEGVGLFVNSAFKEFHLVSSFFSFTSPDVLSQSMTKTKAFNVNSSINNDINASKVELSNLQAKGDITLYPIDRKKMAQDKDLTAMIHMMKQPCFENEVNANRKLSLSFCLRYHSCGCLGRNKKDRLFNDYAQAREMLKGRLDVVFYLNLIKESSLLKHLLLAKEQVNAMNYLRKPNIRSTNDLKIFFNEACSDEQEMRKVKETIKYFNKSQKGTVVNETDYFLVDFLHPAIKAYLD